MKICFQPISDYPDSQAKCPVCEKVVHCHQFEYVNIWPKWTSKFWHKDCGTKWELDINTGVSTILGDCVNEH